MFKSLFYSICMNSREMTSQMRNQSAQQMASGQQYTLKIPTVSLCTNVDHSQPSQGQYRIQNRNLGKDNHLKGIGDNWIQQAKVESVFKNTHSDYNDRPNVCQTTLTTFIHLNIYTMLCQRKNNQLTYYNQLISKFICVLLYYCFFCYTILYKNHLSLVHQTQGKTITDFNNLVYDVVQFNVVEFTRNPEIFLLSREESSIRK